MLLTVYALEGIVGRKVFCSRGKYRKMLKMQASTLGQWQLAQLEQAASQPAMVGGGLVGRTAICRTVGSGNDAIRTVICSEQKDLCAPSSHFLPYV